MFYRPVTELVLELPKQIDEIISQCLQIDREKRYSSIEKLKKHFETIFI
jgi:serine/threonine protein kinase